MAGIEPLPHVALRNKRDQTIDALCAHFAADRLDVDEFERRLDLAHRARAATELDALLADLPATAPARAEPAHPPVEQPPSSRLIAAILGGATRRGHWTPGRRNHVLAFMGGVDLDFRQARLGPGTTEVTVFAILDGAEILVPPELAVEVGGIGLMGAFEHLVYAPEDRGPTTPVLRIDGFALMGGVEVTVLSKIGRASCRERV